MKVLSLALLLSLIAFSYQSTLLKNKHLTKLAEVDSEVSSEVDAEKRKALKQISIDEIADTV